MMSLEPIIGKLTLAAPFSSIQQNLQVLGITNLPITFADTETHLSLPLHHRGPFDLILVAQESFPTLGQSGCAA